MVTIHRALRTYPPTATQLILGGMGIHGHAPIDPAIELDQRLRVYGDEAAAGARALGPLLRADCCPARPAVRVELAGGDRRAAELLLCAHHYRASHRALAAAGARMYDADGMLIAGPNRRTSLWPAV